jgi:phosphatidylserine/phosphatidylglycerophosphate/cardiolipin synthase-like enzyme
MALGMASLQAAGSGKVKTVEELRAALRQNKFVPLAFLKGDEVRLYFTNAEQRLMFDGKWEHARLPVQGFRSHLVELKFDTSPPDMPEPKEQWREPKILAYDDWQRLARSAAETLVQAQPGHGFYVRYALGEAVLYRDSAGKLRKVSFADAPAGLTIDRRLSRTEATGIMAAYMETNLLATYPGVSTFLLAPAANTKNVRLILLDFTERRVIVLLPPRVGVSDGGSAKLSNLASFVFVDNAWAFIKNPVSSAGRGLNLAVQLPASMLNLFHHTKGAEVPPLTPAPTMDLAAWEHWLDTHTGTTRERGSLRLMIDGERFYPVLKSRVDHATNSISILVCTFDTDDAGVEIADKLKQRSTNVAVRVIFDHNSSRTAAATPSSTPSHPGFVPPKSISQYLKDGSQVKVRPFLNPFMTSDHSKVYVIDGRYAYIGGMNLGREYRYEWHDVIAEIQGPVVSSIQYEFDKNWAHASALGDLAFAGRVLKGKPPQPPMTNRSDFIDLRRIYTKTMTKQVRRAELESIRRARSYVFLENPYLFDHSVIVELANARLRGVDVRVVLPSENDIKGGDRSNLETADFLLQHGVRVYFYPGMTHVKALLADGWVDFGSANFNTLSLRLNQETDVATSDPAFAARFRHELFENDFQQSSELKQPVPVSWRDHLADSILNEL